MRYAYEQMLLGVGAVVKAVLYGLLSVFEEAARISSDPRYIVIFVFSAILILCLLA